MATVVDRTQKQAPTGRKVTIEALDSLGDRAPANIEVVINGVPAGVLALGTNKQDAASLEVSDGKATVELRALFLGQVLTVSLPPGKDLALFQFSGATRFAVGRKPVAYCPDGSSGSPCVTCYGPGGVQWRMCC